MQTMQTYTRLMAAQFANRKLEEHGLRKKNWRFRINSNKRRLGVCRYRQRTIEISEHIFSLGKEKVENTILHEIAHAMLPAGVGHGPEWKRLARSIGCDGKTRSEVSMDVPHDWIGTCTECGRTVSKMHRKPKHWNPSLHTKEYARSPYRSRCCRADVRYEYTR